MTHGVRRFLCAVVALLFLFSTATDDLCHIAFAVESDEETAASAVVQTLEASSDGADAAEPASASAEDPSPNPVGEPLPDAGSSGDPADSSDGGAPQDASNSDTSTQTPGDEDTSSAADSSQGKPDNDAASGGEAQDGSTEPVAASEGEVPADEGPAEDPLTAGTYARVATACTVRVGVATDSTAMATVAGGVVYVAEVDSEAAQAKVCFASGTLACTGWTDASALTALTDEETAALSFPEDAPRVGDDPLPDPNAEFLLRLTIDACPVLAPGATCTLRASYSDGADYGVSWSSSDPSIAEVAADGSLTAVAPGSATITAQGICAPASISVTVAVPEPEFLSLNVASIVIGQGETLENALACTVLPEGCDANLTWTSSSTRYVKVDKDTGALYGVRAGSATVAVSTDNGLRAVCKVTVRSAPKSVKLTVSKTVLGVNDAASFAVSFPSNTYSHHIDYSIDNESVLRIENGQLCAVGPGTAKLTARTFNGKTASVAVTVVPAPESVHFASETPVLGVGQEFLLAASVNEGSASAITFTGDNDSVATVTPDGKLVARGEGSCTVTATAYNGISAQQTVTVVPAPTSIALSATSVTLCVGEKVDEPVTVTPDNGMTGGLSFKSSSARYATVSSTGRVSALRAGSVTITVTAYNGVSAKYTVKIVKAPSKLTLTGAKLLGVDDSAVLKVTANAGAGVGQYSLTSSAPEVLRVEPDGRTITAVSVGTAVVTVKNFNGRTSSLSVTVVPAPESVHFASKTPVLGVGQEFLLSASVNEGSASAITFTVDNDSVATVTPDGKLVARGEGSCTVTATAYNGISAQQTVTVVPAPTSIALSATSVTLCVGEKVDEPVTVTPDNGMTGGLSFKSSSARYATVSSTGRVSALRAGSVTITVTAYNGVSAKYTVKIVKAPSKLTLTGAKLLGVDDSAVLKVTANAGAGVGQYSLTSSNPEVLRVEPDGRTITAVSVGTAVVTVKNFNNRTSSLSVTVVPAPESVHFAGETPVLGVGQEFLLSASVNEGSVSAITFTGDNDSVATVTPDGKLVARGEGSCTVTATAYNGISAQQTVTVVPAPTSIALSATSVTLCVGEKVDEPVTVTPDNGMTGGLSFKSSSARYATVSSTGRVSALRAGSVTITVTAYNGVSAKYTVKIVKAPSKLTLTGAKLLGVDDSAVLKVTANAGAGVGQYSLTSSAPEVLRVEPDGRTITAVSVGTAVVTARNFNGKTASVAVTVVPAPESVHFANATPVLGVGQEFLLSASVNEGSVSAITFTGDNDSVATVTPDGKLVARGEGSCTVTATAYNGVSAQQTVTVVPAPTSMEFAETPVYLGLNETLTDALRIVLNEGSAAGISFKSSSTRYVKVDASTGKLTGVRVGNAVITATSHNGLTATCRVIVQKAPTKVTLKAPMPAFSVGQTQQVSVTVTGRGHYTLTSSNPDVIAVEEGDVLQALSEGVATITARTYNGKTASINITVAPAPQEIHPCTEMLSVGECLSVQAEFAVNAGSYTDFTYAVEDPEVASVDASGLVTGLRSGSTRIFATTHNGLSASVELTVLPAPESIQFESNPLTIGLGELRPLHFIAAPENAVGVYTYASDNAKIVSVSEDGTLAGIATGTATVTVTAQNGTSAALEVTVVPYSSVNSAYCMAHRGASGYYPGNSLAAFRYAAVLGADMVELDVRKSLDGTIVVVHDSTISYNGKKYSVANLTLQQIRIANPDICTLDEALALIASTDMEVMIEFKIAGIEQDVLDCVDANGLQNRAKYGSFTLSVINKVKALRPSAETIYIMNTTDTLNKVVSNPSAYSASTISVSSSILTPTAIYRLHLGGKQVVAWTINSRSEIARFVAMGVDGITTDYPDYM